MPCSLAWRLDMTLGRDGSPSTLTNWVSFSGPAGSSFLYYSVLRQHANLKKAAGQINGSLALFEEVVRGEEHEFGEGHPVLARTYSGTFIFKVGADLVRVQHRS